MAVRIENFLAEFIRAPRGRPHVNTHGGNETEEMPMNHAVDADTASLRRCGRFACVVAALAAGALIAAVPHRARAHDAQDAQASAAEARCRAAVQNAPQPPLGHSPLLVRVLQPSVEPVPATDGLIHLAYMTQLTNAIPASVEPSVDIVKAVAVDPTAKFTPTGLNIELDHEGKDVAGEILPFVHNDFMPIFDTSVPTASGGWMLFDVTYTNPAQIPPVLANAITYNFTDPTTMAVVEKTELTDPVPVGCVPLAVIHPPWSGMAGMRKTAAAPTRFTTAQW